MLILYYSCKYVIIFALIIFSNAIPLACQSQFIYFPEREIIKTPQEEGLYFESVYIKTQDEVIISGWWIPSPLQRGVVLFCHGNAGNISYRMDSVKIFYSLGLSTFIFDYRGYGDSEGKPSEKGTYLDADAAWKYLVHTRNISSDKIIIFGRSLGGAIAAWLAQKHTSRVLIVESTFTSIKDVAREFFPSFMVNLILRYEYSTKEYIRNVQSPILIVHSQDDELIPFEHSQELFKLAREPKEFIKIYGSHNEGFIHAIDIYKSGLEVFISKYLGK